MSRFRPRGDVEIDGILPVDKPTGPTSHDIVAEVRRRFRLRKVGHGGTLDPMATGLLLLLLGRGAKLSERIMGSDKTYEGVMTLGVSTDSQDADGEVLEERPWTGVTREQVEEQMRARVGDQMQTPPMVSAVKIDGVPLYKRARKGETVDRPARLIHVYRFQLDDFRPPEVAFTLKCTKGAYVRTLCHEIGEALGCGAHLSALRRTRIGSFDIRQAVTMEALADGGLDELQRKLISISAYLAGEQTP